MQKVKKLCKQEQVQNERLTEFKNRIESDIENTRKRLEEENDKRARIELQLDTDQTIIEQMERDMKKAIAVIFKKSFVFRLLYCSVIRITVINLLS